MAKDYCSLWKRVYEPRLRGEIGKPNDDSEAAIQEILGLTGEEAEEMDRHLTSCPECLKVWDQMKEETLGMLLNILSPVAEILLPGAGEALSQSDPVAKR